MRAIFVYIGIFLWIVSGLLLGAYAVNPGSQTLAGAGVVVPSYYVTNFLGTYQAATPVGLPFYEPGTNTSITFTVNYQFGNTSTVVTVYPCPGGSQSISCYNWYGQPLLTLHGASSTGTFSGHVGEWYIVNASDPVKVQVSVPPSPSALGEEIGAAGLGAGGAALFILGLIMRDPLNRPAPRLAQLKRTLYFFFQSRLAVLGLVLLMFYILVAVLSPVIAPYSPPGGGCGGFGCNGDYVILPVQWAYSPCTQTNCPSPIYATDFTNDWQCVYPSFLATNFVPPGDCVSYAAGTVSSPAANSQNNLIPPTWTLWPFNPGPVPMGSMALTSGSAGTYVDIFTSLVRATPWDLAISVGIVAVGAFVGLLLGTFSGYMGGITDEIVMRITDVFLSIPGFFLVLVIMASLFTQASGLPNDERVRIGLLMGAFIIVWWPGYTRILRGQVLVTREQKYVEAARASGAGPGWILRKHIIPNSIFPMLVQFSLDVGSIPLALGGIAFLGFGTYLFSTPNGSPFPEWGVLSSYEVGIGSASGQDLFATVTSNIPFPWWELLFPGLALFMFCIAVNFLSDGLRDALDPRLRR